MAWDNSRWFATTRDSPQNHGGLRKQQYPDNHCGSTNNHNNHTTIVANNNTQKLNRINRDQEATGHGMLKPAWPVSNQRGLAGGKLYFYAEFWKGATKFSSKCLDNYVSGLLYSIVISIDGNVVGFGFGWILF